MDTCEYSSDGYHDTGACPCCLWAARKEIDRLRSEALDHKLSLEIIAKGAERAAEIERLTDIVVEQQHRIASLLPPGETSTAWAVHLARLEEEIERLRAALLWIVSDWERVQTIPQHELLDSNRPLAYAKRAEAALRGEGGE